MSNNRRTRTAGPRAAAAPQAAAPEAAVAAARVEADRIIGDAETLAAAQLAEALQETNEAVAALLAEAEKQIEDLQEAAAGRAAQARRAAEAEATALLEAAEEEGRKLRRGAANEADGVKAAAEAAARTRRAEADAEAEAIRSSAEATAQEVTRAATAQGEQALERAKAGAAQVQAKADQALEQARGEAVETRRAADEDASRARSQAADEISRGRAELDRIRTEAEARADVIRKDAAAAANRLLADARGEVETLREHTRREVEAARESSQRELDAAKNLAADLLARAEESARHLNSRAEAALAQGAEIKEKADKLLSAARQEQAEAARAMTAALDPTVQKLERKRLQQAAKEELRQARLEQGDSVPVLSAVHKLIVTVVLMGAAAIAAIGFTGSYQAVRRLAVAQGFGAFSAVMPVGVDAGIVVMLVLDLLLTWLGLARPMLRYAAWALTFATIWFNAASAWPNPVGVGMHSVMPLLVIILTEAARGAFGEYAQITEGSKQETPRLDRWLLALPSTARMWRRMRLWGILRVDEALNQEQDLVLYRDSLRSKYGRKWRRKASAEELLVLRKAHRGHGITPGAVRLAAASARGTTVAAPPNPHALPSGTRKGGTPGAGRRGSAAAAGGSTSAPATGSTSRQGGGGGSTAAPGTPVTGGTAGGATGPGTTGSTGTPKGSTPSTGGANGSSTGSTAGQGSGTAFSGSSTGTPGGAPVGAGAGSPGSTPQTGTPAVAAGTPAAGTPAGAPGTPPAGTPAAAGATGIGTPLDQLGVYRLPTEPVLAEVQLLLDAMWERGGYDDLVLGYLSKSGAPYVPGEAEVLLGDGITPKARTTTQRRLTKAKELFMAGQRTVPVPTSSATPARTGTNG